MKIINITLFLLEIALFIGLYIYYLQDPLYRYYNVFFHIAKLSGLIININFFLIIVISNKIWKRWFYYNSITLRKLHIYIFYWICIFSLIHIVSHSINFTKINNFNAKTGTFITGILLIFILLSFTVLAKYKRLLHVYYDRFMKFHFVCLVAFVIILSVHGIFCAVPIGNVIGNVKCPSATSWIWILCGLSFYIINAILNIKKCIVFCKIVDYYFVSRDIVQVVLGKHCQGWIGKTIYILIPSINKFEWHPFTVVNDNSIYIKRRGDWTTNLFLRLNNNENPRMLTNGPYKTFPDIKLQDLKMDNYLVLIATGIGITSFLSKIHSLSSSTKLYVIIIVKTINDIIWLKSFFLQHKNVKFLVYITQSERKQSERKQSERNVYYKNGRPDFNDIFDNALLENMFIEMKKMDFYFSGCETVYDKVKAISKKYDTFRLLYI